MNDWYPEATIRRYRFDGGSMVGGPARCCIHTTETRGVPVYGDPLGANSAPHFTVATDGVVFQHHPLSRASRSLRNLSGGVQTNRQGRVNVQIEIVGYARNGSNLPRVQLEALRILVHWIRLETQVPFEYRKIVRGSHCYGYDSRCRMTSAEWLAFSGLYCHQEVPENTHWDAGAWDFEVLRMEDGTMLTPEQESVLAAVADVILARGSNGEGFAGETLDLVRHLKRFGRDQDEEVQR